MKTNKTATKVLAAIFSVALMIGGGILLEKTVNDFYLSTPAMTTLGFALLSVFMYVAGATIISNCADDSREIKNSRVFGGFHHGVIFALIGIAAGALLLGFNTGFLNPVWKDYFFSWYMLIAVLGVICIFRRHIVTGIIMVAAGKFFLIDKAAALFPGDVIFEKFISTYWPVLLIVVCVLILLAIVLRPLRYGKSNYKGQWKENYVATEAENKDGEINYRFVFAGAEQVILAPVFRGGSVEVVFGGMVLDLRRTTLPEGETFLHVRALCGGLQINAPDSWEIEFRTKAFFGGVNDERPKNIDKDTSRKLIITADCTFGGINIEKNQ